MSLINEALKRARDEAVRREASNRGIPLAPMVPTGEHNRWFPITVLVLAVALVVSLVVVVNLSSKLTGGTPATLTEDLPRSEPAVHAYMDSTMPHAAEAPGNSPPPTTPESVPAGDDSGASATAALPSPALPPPNPKASATSEPKILDAPPQAPVPPKQANSPAKQATGPEARVFVLQAKLESGQSVDLGGIAWSEAGPYALLNGRVVGVGDSVHGYRVSKIDPGQVTLERDNDRVILRLK